MSEDMNSVIIVGRLTKDMETQYSNSGFAIGKMSVAVNNRKKQGEEWIDEASFFDVTLFGKRAESLGQYLVKGTQLAITGKLKQDRWEQDGQKRSRIVIEANNVQLLGGKSNGQTSQQQQSTPQQNGRFEEQIPF